MIAPFAPLFLSTLLLLSGTGLLNMYMGLYLAQQQVSETWIGAVMAGYYVGLVCGGRLGHLLISRVGHIRAFAGCAAVATCIVLAQGMAFQPWFWLVLRIFFGLMIVTTLMVIESWLNEQTENRLRGRVFSVYLVVSSLGTMLGQMAMTLYDTRLDEKPLTLAAMACALCLVPLTVVSSTHPAIPRPAPLGIDYYLRRVPTALLVLFVSGLVLGAFYGLGPVYAVKVGLTPAQSAVFMSVVVGCALLSQWPMGWLSDRIGRVRLIRANAVLLAALPVLLWGWFAPPYWLLLVFACVQGPLQSSLYPLGVALANDRIDPDRRVGMSAIVLMTYGVGACLGPLVVGWLMEISGPSGYYLFVSACALLLVLLARFLPKPSSPPQAA